MEPSTIGEKNNFINSQRDQAETPLETLKGTALEDTRRFYFGFWSLDTPLFFGMDVPDENINEEGAIEFFEELGEGYGKWAQPDVKWLLRWNLSTRLW